MAIRVYPFVNTLYCPKLLNMYNWLRTPGLDKLGTQETRTATPENTAPDSCPRH